jgi:hypothetical protein
MLRPYEGHRKTMIAMLAMLGDGNNATHDINMQVCNAKLSIVAGSRVNNRYMLAAAVAGENIRTRKGFHSCLYLGFVFITCSCWA